MVQRNIDFNRDAKEKIMKKRIWVALIGLFLLSLPVPAQINLLREFAAGAADGKKPYGSLLFSGSTLYGMTYFGRSAMIWARYSRYSPMARFYPAA